nr:AAA family ATPase [Clostridia bacterium]
MKDKTAYICTECEYKSAKWYGKCPSCGSWNTFEEYTPKPESPRRRSSGVQPMRSDGEMTAATIPSLRLPEYIRSSTAMGELDRVLGGGLVSGSVVLLAGEPGIGKSTLLTQISDSLSKDKRVLYVSGEESPGQLKLRADRLGVVGGNIYVLTETNIDSILDEAQAVNPG